MAGEWVADAVLDGAFSVITTNVTEGYVTDQTVTTRADAVTNSLADYTPTFGSVTDGDASGRKLPMNQVTGITVDTSGTASHVALTSATTLYYVTSCTSQSLTASNTLTVNAWDIEIEDPTAA